MNDFWVGLAGRLQCDEVDEMPARLTDLVGLVPTTVWADAGPASPRIDRTLGATPALDP